MKIKRDKKVLIIKLGYSETLDPSLSLTTSLGDVLRTTVILHFFKGDHVSWLVDEKALPLLKDNKYINRIWTYNSSTVSQLKKEKFDVIVNLEKLPEVCLLADSLLARDYFGFRFHGLDKDAYNCYASYASSKKLIELIQNVNKRRKNKDYWQSILAEALGKKWDGEGYILGYKPRSEIKYDIGFNWITGNKWTNKAWPRAYWQELESLIKDKYSISWQEGLNSIYEYIEWINSCRLIITADTLGLHVSLALKKRIIALFGPTSPGEICLYNRGSFLLPEVPYKCIPCFKPHCDKERQCMEYITPQKVKERIEDEFKKITIASKV